MAHPARTVSGLAARPLPLVVCLCLALLLPGRAVSQTGNTILYVYDEMGRLVGVIDPAGETATYAYDAAGNLLSITRRSSALVSIIELTPDSGAVGAVVTIYGTGFSTTPSQNAVTFNGTAATVTSATATKLVTTVPAGATTGSVVVTTSAGTATSAAPFTVSDTAPSITSFTPTVGAAGTSVTVTGTNFETDTFSNKLKFNAGNATVNSATATSITTNVPAATGSGRIGVSTPNGGATSSGDFFIPPSPYTAADVVTTGRMATGEVKAVSVGAASKIGMIVFDGTAGQRVSLKISGVTMSGTGYVDVHIKKINNTNLASSTTINSSGAFIDAQTLPATGTYTIVVDPHGNNTGGLTLTLYSFPADFASTITPGGATVTATTTVPGQNGLVTFTGAAGQRVSLKVTGVSMAGGTAYADFRIRKPDGTNLASSTFINSSTFIDTQTLPVAGAYTILVDPHGWNTGSAALTLYDVPADVTDTITPGGSPVTVTTTVPGQNARASFAATANQRVSLRVTGVSLTGGNGYVDVSIKRPDGTTQVSSTFINSSGEYVDTQTLAAAGTYTILVDPQSTNVGGATLTLYDIPADITGPITPGGSPVTVTTTVPGQRAILSFSGTANQRVSFKITGVSMTGNGWVNVYLKKPDGTNLASDTFDSGGGFVDEKTLPTAGTYTILVDPYSSNTGTATVTLYDVPADVTASITPGGAAVTVTTTVPGQNGILSFSGTANQRVSLKVSGVSMSGTNSWVNVYLKKPDGTNIASDTFDSSGGFVDVKTLATTGTYTILVDPYRTNTGSATVTLYDVPADVTGTITPGGAAVTATNTTPGQNVVLSFSGTANQRVSLRVTGVTMSGTNSWVNVYLRKPDGTNLASDTFDSSGGYIDVKTLPATGTYTILVDPYRSNTGSANVTLYDVPADATGSVTVGGSATTVTTTVPGQNASVTFSGTSGQQVTVRMTGNTMGVVTVRLLRPDGTQVTTTASSSTSFNLSTQTLGATGVYTISIDPSGTNIGSLSVNVTNP